MSATPQTDFFTGDEAAVSKYDPRTMCGMSLCRQQPSIIFHAVRPCDHAPKRLDIGLCPRHEYTYDAGIACQECHAPAAFSEPVRVATER